jgi:hypothetical protein
MFKIAVGVRDGEFFLIATVVRGAAGEVYVNWPRNHIKDLNPHTRHHTSGQLHHKSFGKPFVTRKKQKPDATFRGTTNLVSFGLAAGEHKTLNFRAQPKEFDAAFEISS